MKKYLIISILSVCVILLSFVLIRASTNDVVTAVGVTPSTSEDSHCKFKEITLDLVRSLPGGEDARAEDVKILNDQTPYCIDMCKEELQKSKQNQKDWNLSNKDKEMCSKLGIILPK